MSKTQTGCRPAQLFGMWMIEPQQFRKLYEQAMRVDLVALGELRHKVRSGMDDDDDDESDFSGDGYEIDSGGIARFDINGVMTKYPTSFQDLFGGTSTLRLRQQIRAARADDRVLGAMICVDSPGGTCDGTKELADEISAFAAAKPCVGYGDGLVCSAAYWCYAACGMCFASPTTLAGSIGTRLRLEDSSEQYKQDGVKVHELATGDMKAAGADGTPITDKQVTYFQGIVDDLQQFFASTVQSKRNLSSDQMSAIADGRIMVAEKAKAAGLVDRVGTYDDARMALLNKVFFGSSL